MVLKGILDPEDAREAVRFGADGIVVSNHGGRQLDGVLSSARPLPAIADAVQGDLTILADSGVRSGLDVVRMLALGADGVLLGRPFVYALAAAGEQGVVRVGPDRQRDAGGDDPHRGAGGWGDFAGESGAGGWLRPV